MNKAEITKAVDTLSSAVEAEQQAFQAWEIHAKDYQKKLEELHKENAFLILNMQAAEQHHKAAKEAKTIATKAVREIAPAYFGANPEARNEIPGLSYRLERKPVYTPRHFVDAAIAANATFLLQPDEKAIKAFVKGMSTQNKKTKLWSLPDSIHVWFGDNLEVENDYMTTIAEDKLAAKVEGETE